ncbi:MAG: RNase H family protein, partial [Candidatus Promineifilaceae bacterium]
IEWHWVRGHTGDRLNERADRLARRARLEITAGPETEAGVARVYARVAFKGPAGPGAWGLILESAGGETQQFSAVEDKTTNNRLELQAVIESLRLVSAGSRIQLVTSSDYVYQGATRWLAGWRQGGWKTKAGKPVSNQDLWRELEALAAVREVRWLSAKQIGAEPALDEAARVAAEALRAAL